MGHPRGAPIGEYIPFPITTLGTALPVGALVSTTSTTVITAGNNVTVTPASITNIMPGMVLNFANGTGVAETVTVLSVNYSAGTFTANFANDHSGAYTIISLKGTYVGRLNVNTAGTSITITLYNGHPSTLPVPGQVFASITPVAGASMAFDCFCSRGLFYTVAGTTAGSYTIMYLDSNV
jgi:hypothetical protein